MTKIMALLMSIFMWFSSVTGTISAYLKVLPDLTEVGIDYISMNSQEYVSYSDVKSTLVTAEKNLSHPFVLVTQENFNTAKTEYETGSFSDYTKSLSKTVFTAADELLNTEKNPPLAYQLDEEDSILPISREVFNRIVILGYAWKITGDNRYANRAVMELQNVCAYPDWCTGHFLATAEMALAVATGYDWFFDYLTDEQKEQFSDITWEYAITPALSVNHIKNWFIWSKNNWNSICYSGIGIACMVFADKNPAKAAEFLTLCYRNMPLAYENFTPDGVYAEGPGYCQSGMNALVFFVATSLNHMKTDFGLSEIDGFKELGYFPLEITTPTGVFNYGDNKNIQCFSPVLHWYADYFETPILSAYQINDTEEQSDPDVTTQSVEANGEYKENALSLLWLNRSYVKTDNDFSDEAKAKLLESDYGVSLCLMRSAYLDKTATFAGIKGGYNYTNHTDLDIGTFVFDALGERWAEELGRGSYDAPDYFVNLPLGGRWKNYCKRAEGQNTLVINPDAASEDQYAFAKGSFTEFSETEGGAKATLDMSEAYCMNYVKKAERTFEMYNNFTNLRITDKVSCNKKSEIYWFMHTKADIEISEDGKTAILTKNGKQVKVSSLKDGTFSVMKAEALNGKYEYDADYENFSKLTVHLTDVVSAEIEITLEPIYENNN